MGVYRKKKKRKKSKLNRKAENNTRARDMIGGSVGLAVVFGLALESLRFISEQMLVFMGLKGRQTSALPQPPSVAELLLHFLLSKDERETLGGDLAERYFKLHEERGAAKASRWYYGQVIRSFRSLVIRALTKAGRFILGKENKHDTP